MEGIIKADALIIGGGASGISAALEIKRICPDSEVVIAERLDRTGKKILSTGNGRCNLSNKNISNDNYHGTVQNIMEIIHNTQSSEDFFMSLGVPCVSDDEGRIYPYSKSAASVLTSLRIKLKSENIKEICGFNAVNIEKNQNGYIVTSEDGREIYCRKIIAACGGYASPSNGTDGRALKMFREMGYHTSKICPAVAPLKVSPEQVKGLKGVRVYGCVSAVSEGKVLKKETGEIQFTENTVSGICVFNLACLFSRYEGKLDLKVDLMPDMSKNDTMKLLHEIKKARNTCTLEEYLNGLFVKNLAVYIVKRSVRRPLTDIVTKLSEDELSVIASCIKSLEFKVTGCSSWQNAQVTSGGISGLAVDRFLMSKKDDGIYFAGEILDVDGDCGGYNLEWAWSPGKWAGKHCAETIKKSKR